MSIRNLFLLLFPIVAFTLVTSCGARSGLEAGLVQGGAGGEEAVKCVAGKVALTRANPTVMFVLDRSTSMGKVLEATSGGVTRWESLISGLSSTLPSVDGSMEIGALLFPIAGASQNGGQSCSVPGLLDLLPGTGHVAALLALMNGTSPGGMTPTADAVDVAGSLLLGVRAATTGRALVLATDGAPDCNAALDSAMCRCSNGGASCKGKSTRCLDDARTLEVIGKYQAMGLPTYVIGIQEEGDSSFSDVLDAMASAGGRPKMGGEQQYYAARSQAELDTALAAIRDQVGQCTYLSTSVPDDDGSITVTLGDTAVPQDTTGVEGWTWGSKSNGEIVLVGSACAAAAADGSPALTAVVQCKGS